MENKRARAEQRRGREGSPGEGAWHDGRGMRGCGMRGHSIVRGLEMTRTAVLVRGRGMSGRDSSFLFTFTFRCEGINEMGSR